MNIADIIRDMQRRYSGSYIFLRSEEDGEEVLCYVESILPNNSKDESSFNQPATLTLSSSTTGKISVNLGSANQIINRFPKTGVFQKDKRALLFQRKANKQYVRGVNQDNSAIYDPVGSIYPSIVQPSLKEENLLAAYSQKTFSFAEAISLINNNGYFSCALEHDFIIVSPIDRDNSIYILMHKFSLVALINSRGKIIKEINGPLTRYAKEFLITRSSNENN